MKKFSLGILFTFLTGISQLCFGFNSGKISFGYDHSESTFKIGYRPPINGLPEIDITKIITATAALTGSMGVGVGYILRSATNNGSATNNPNLTVDNVNSIEKMVYDSENDILANTQILDINNLPTKSNASINTSNIYVRVSEQEDNRLYDKPESQGEDKVQISDMVQTSVKSLQKKSFAQVKEEINQKNKKNLQKKSFAQVKEEVKQKNKSFFDRAGKGFKKTGTYTYNSVKKLPQNYSNLLNPKQDEKKKGFQNKGELALGTALVCIAITGTTYGIWKWYKNRNQGENQGETQGKNDQS